MKALTLENVIRTYNGRSGCMCGCNGKYSIHDANDIERLNKEAGWEAHDEDDVRPGSVKAAIRKLSAAVQAYGDKVDARGEYRDNDVWFFMSDEFVSIDHGDRTSTAYFR
jgi:hypothetical protein